MTDDPRVLTFGCRLNAYESEVIRANLDQNARQNVVVVNTCAVTAEAERQARQAIRKAKREQPGAEIIVTGCAAQISPDLYLDMPEVDRVIGNAEKMQPVSFQSGINDPLLVDDIMAVKETAGHLVAGFDGRARAFLQVQNGCDHRCTFCIIPYGRGNSRSAPIGHVVSQARDLIAGGVQEIVLTGVDITSYGPDLPGQPTLGQLCRRLLAQLPELKRLRLSSLDPVEIDDDLWRLIAEEERLMPHLHLSLQAGDDMVLKRMKRRHDRQTAIDLCVRARDLRPGITFGADLIAGFPTETDEMFQNTLDIVDECGLTWLHVFPYSEREGTPAARMPSVPKPLRKERAARLRARGAEIVAAHIAAQALGHDIEVLVERDTRGHSADFTPVMLTEPAAVGTLVRATGIEARDDLLIARAA